MRAVLAGILIGTGVLAVALTPSPSAQGLEGPPEGTLFFTNNEVRSASDPLCGDRPDYKMSADPPSSGRAYLSRALLGSPAPVCETDFEFTAERAFNVSGTATATFPLSCELIGVIQNFDEDPLLESVNVELLRNGDEEISEGFGSTDGLVCTGFPITGSPPPMVVSVGIPVRHAEFVEGDTLTVRLKARAVNTDPGVRPYWYVLTGAPANITAPGLKVPKEPESPPPSSSPPGTTPTPQPTSPAPSGTTTPPPPGTTTSSASPTRAPECSRDSPPDPEELRRAGEPFTVRARCSDPDDDLDHGDWTVDGDRVAGEPLGKSPAFAEREFRFDKPATHEIQFIPTDEMGRVGTPASWVVHVEDPQSGAPHCDRDEPRSFEITRTAGEPFRLRAVCADPDDDLSHGDWRVDDAPVDRDELGDSPDTAEHEFTFDAPGDRTIQFSPKDESGHHGTSATWVVHVGDAGRPAETTSPTTSIPVFPSGPALVLGAAGALGGALLILRRRG